MWVVAIAGVPGAIALVLAIVLWIRLRARPGGPAGAPARRDLRRRRRTAGGARARARAAGRADRRSAGRGERRWPRHTNAGLPRRAALPGDGPVRRLPGHGRPAVVVDRDAERARRAGPSSPRSTPATTRACTSRSGRGRRPASGSPRRRSAPSPLARDGAAAVHLPRRREAEPARESRLPRVRPGRSPRRRCCACVGPEPEQRLVPYATVVDCFEAVRPGAVPEALVPIENSIEGSVNQTLDQLAAGVGERADPRRGGASGAPPPDGPRRPHVAGRAARALAPARARPSAGVAPGEPARGRDRRGELDRGRRAHRGRLDGAVGGDRTAARRRHLRGRGHRGRHRGLPRQLDALRAPRAPSRRGRSGRGASSRRSSARSAARPSGRAAGDPPGVRDARRQPDASWRAAPRRPAWAGTCSSSTWRAAGRATSPVDAAITRDRGAGRRARSTFLGSYPAGAASG